MTHGNRKMIKIFSWLGALFMTLVIALSFKIYYALQTDQPVLDKNYYEKGLHYDAVQQARANSDNRLLISDLQSPSGGKVNSSSLTTGANQKEILYRDAEGQPIAGAKISLELSRRATVNDNVHANCQTNDQGKCTLEVNMTHQGYWEGWLQASDPDGQYRLQGVFYVNPRG